MTDSSNNPEEVLAQINLQEDSNYSLIKTFAGGREEGAHLLKDSSDRLIVLKYREHEKGWLDYIQDVGRVVAQLIEAGYPTPPMLASGSLASGLDYCLLGHVEGEPLGNLTVESLPLVLDVIDLQTKLDIPSKRDWCVMVYLTVCKPDSDVAKVIRDYSPGGAKFSARVQQSLLGMELADLPRDDIVHGDFNASNIIMKDGRLAGVIDFQSVGRGTRVIDVATLLFTEWTDNGDTSIARNLFDHSLSIADSKVLLMCLARTAYARIQGSVLRGEEPKVTDQLLTSSHNLLDWLAR